MAIKGAKSIAEYAMLRWIREHYFDMEGFSFTVNGNEGILKDQLGEYIVLVYDPETKSVYVKEPAETVDPGKGSV